MEDASGNELINAGIGLLLFFLPAGITFGIWMLGDEIWKLWGKKIWESKKGRKQDEVKHLTSPFSVTGSTEVKKQRIIFYLSS